MENGNVTGIYIHVHLIQALVFRKQPVEVIGSLLQNISDVILETQKNKITITTND